MLICSNVKSFLSNTTIEPVFFLYALCLGFYIVVSQNLYVAKVCKVNLNISTEICEEIQSHKEEQSRVQEYVSSLQAYNSIIQAIPSCLFALFAGPWSDSHGRKTLMICSIFGHILSNSVFIINTFFFYELKAEYLLFEFIQDMTGGNYVFYLASYCYISDISSKETRTRRISFLNGVFLIGFFLGNGLSGVIKTHLGFMYNFSLSILSAILALTYCIFFVKDSKLQRDQRLTAELEKEIEELRNGGCFEEVREKEGELFELSQANTAGRKKHYLKELFNFKNLKEGLGAVLKKREHNKRAVIICLIITFGLDWFAFHGRQTSLYLYFRRQLEWTIIEYSRYTSVLAVIGMLSHFVVVPALTAKLLSDSTLALIDASTSIINHVIIAFCFGEWMLYVGGVVSLLDKTSTTLTRSIITKNIQANEVGKVFSVVGTIQAFCPLAAGTIFGSLYRNTVSYFPAAFLFLIIAGKSIEFLLLLTVFFLLRKNGKIRPVEE